MAPLDITKFEYSRFATNRTGWGFSITSEAGAATTTGANSTTAAGGRTTTGSATTGAAAGGAMGASAGEACFGRETGAGTGAGA